MQLLPEPDGKTSSEEMREQIAFLIEHQDKLTESEFVLAAQAAERLSERILEQERLEEAEKLRSSLYYFVTQAWEHVEDDSFVSGWHIEMVCQYVQACEEGQFVDLLVNIPPQTGKSTIISVIYPAWAWSRNPKLKFYCFSYALDLGIRDLLKCRKLIVSDWYQKYFGDTVKLGGADKQTHIDIYQGGWRKCSTPGGKATGEHPDRQILDDVNSAQKAESEKERSGVNEWWDLTMSTRGAAKDRRRIGVQQRFHMSDWTGHLLRKQESNWQHLCLPMRYEKGRMEPAPGLMDDPRSEAGELLWPRMFPLPKVQSIERDLGVYGTAGQYQQRPTSREGAIFKVEKLRVVHESRVPWAKIVKVVRAWDKAGTKDSGCYTAGVLMGLYRSKEHGDLIYVIDVARKQWSVREVEGQMSVHSRIDEAKFGFDRLQTVFEREPGASGKQAAQETIRNLKGRRIQAIEPQGSKIVRAEPLASAIEAEEVILVKGHWNTEFEAELQAFPKADDKDQVDAASLAYMKLVRGTWGGDPLDDDDEEIRWKYCDNHLCDRVCKPNQSFCCECCETASLSNTTAEEHSIDCTALHTRLYSVGDWEPASRPGNLR